MKDWFRTFAWRRWGIVTIAFSALFALAWYGHRYASLEALAQHEWELRSAIAQHPWQAFFIGLGVFTLLSLVPGAVGKTVVSGWLFGFWAALAISSIGLTLAALAAFELSRYLLRDWVEDRLGGIIGWINRVLEREGVFYLLVVRLMHAPYTAVNYSAGASRVRPGTLVWTTFAGLFPSNAVHAWLGAQLPTLDELARDGPMRLLEPWLVVAWIVLATLPFVVRWSVRAVRGRPVDRLGDMEHSETGTEDGQT